MAYTDRELFARLIRCEAGGEGDDGMRAVASVVMNRTFVPYGEFQRVSDGGNVRNIIQQPGQSVRQKNQKQPVTVQFLDSYYIDYHIEKI